MRGIERDDRTLPVTERLLGHGLHVLANRQHDVAFTRRVGEQARQLVELQRGGLAGEVVVVVALDPVGPEVERVVARDVGEQIAVGIDPLEAQRGPAFLRCRQRPRRRRSRCRPAAR